MDSESFAYRRDCFVEKRVIFNESNKNALICKINPSVFIDGIEISNVILTARHEGFDILDFSKYPCFVHICIYKNKEKISNNYLNSDDISILAWGELYKH
jgi:hypothetical protein